MGVVQQLIGEAASHVSDAVKSAHSEIPWREIVGMRHVIVHGYRDIDSEVVWAVTDRDLPPLSQALKGLLGPEQQL